MQDTSPMNNVFLYTSDTISNIECRLRSRIEHIHCRRHHRVECCCKGCKTDGTEYCSIDKPCSTCEKSS